MHATLAAWIWGSLFLVFILGFLVFVLTRGVSQPAALSASGPESVAGDCSKKNDPHHITRDYRLAYSSTAYVNYPFGLQVIFPASMLPERAKSNTRRGFQESDYHSWSKAVEQDSQLVIENGQIEFETGEAEPAIRVELRFAPESFDAIQTAETQNLLPGQDISFPLWLSPIEARRSTLTVVIAQDGPRAKSALPPKEAGLELAVIPLTVTVEHFPIRLR
jgi:hypothetical protein